MIFTYLAIFKEANRQEKQIHARIGNQLLQNHNRELYSNTNGKFFFGSNILWLYYVGNIVIAWSV